VRSGWGLICEVVPGNSAIALLLNPDNPTAEIHRKDVQAAAQALGRRLLTLHARTDTDIEPSFAMLKQEQAGALIVQNEPFFDSRRDRIMSLAARNAVPAIYHIREFPEAGGLMSYGASLAILIARPEATSAGFSRAKSPPICRLCSPPISNW
jgi:putative ABC transport system substrate-binding protein